jgi:DNA-binding NarL/FixJ family response regulator
MVSVLVVDDHPVVRSGIRALLSSLDGIEVCGEADSGESALREAHLLKPDVVIMDVQMRGGDGIEATRRICAALPDTAVLVLTMFEDQATVLAALEAGARGYLLKGAGQDEIEHALHAAAVGETVFGPSIAKQLLDAATGTTPVPAKAFPQLTPRELQILDRIARGEGNAAIALSFAVANKTVSNHISAIFAKLRVATRAEAIVLARENGLGRNASGQP